MTINVLYNNLLWQMSSRRLIDLLSEPSLLLYNLLIKLIINLIKSNFRQTPYLHIASI